jgi:hypothetical protein
MYILKLLLKVVTAKTELYVSYNLKVMHCCHSCN